MIQLHNNANATTIAVARILIFTTWIIWFITDNSYLIANVELELFHKHGFMKLFSDNFYSAITPSTILILKSVIIYCLFCTVIGGPKPKWHMFISLVLITFYMGYIRGFGGHANHRELTMLYCSYVLLLTPCFDALTLYGKNIEQKNQNIYQASMLTICLIILIQYSVIGIARLTLGTPHSFNPDVMAGLIINRNLRPNNFGIQIGLYLMDYPWLKYITAFMLPFSTFLEIISPLVLIINKKWRTIIIFFLISFHLGIFLLMNIFFIENIIILLLLFNYTKFIDIVLSKKSKMLHEIANNINLLFSKLN